MNRHQKTQAVVELTHEFNEAEAVYAVDYRGLTVAQISELRVRLADQDTKLKVVKNRVTKLAAEQADSAGIGEHLVGPTALAFVRGDAAAAAKTLSTFSRETDNILELKGGLFEGNPLTAAEVGEIAKLPSREVLYQQLVGLIASPISGTARTLNALLSAVPVQLQKISEQGLIGGDAPSAPAETAEAPAQPAAAEDTPAEPSGDATPEADASPETTDSNEG